MRDGAGAWQQLEHDDGSSNVGRWWTPDVVCAWGRDVDFRSHAADRICRSARSGTSCESFGPKRHVGTGPRSFKLGRRVFYRWADLEAWIAAQAEADSRRRAG